MFSIYLKRCIQIGCVYFTVGCSPFLDDPAPYPPDPSLQDQMVVDSTLRYDQFVPVPQPRLDQAVEQGGSSGGRMNSAGEDPNTGGDLGGDLGGELNTESSSKSLRIDQPDEGILEE